MQINTEKTTACPIDVASALNWLCKSGIQDSSGGFYAWYDTSKSNYSFLYPEITGYAIRLLCKINQQYGSFPLLRAVKAADWLLSIQNSDGSFFCKQYKNQIPNIDESFYVFDAGIISSALIDLYKIVANEEYIKAALKTMNLILSMQNTDGSFKAAKNPKGKLLRDSYWSQTSGCHHLKLLIPLLQTYKLTLDERFLKASKKLLNWGLNLQSANGSFLDYPNAKTTYTHAHCYATEGLLAASESFDTKTAIQIKQRIEKSVNWLLRSQNSDGSIYNWNDNRPDKIKTSDALAQTLRLYVVNRNKNIETENYEKGFIFLNQTQLLEGNHNAFGGLVYGTLNGQKIGHVSACVTIFSVHAALLAEYGQTGSLLQQII